MSTDQATWKKSAAIVVTSLAAMATASPLVALAFVPELSLGDLGGPWIGIGPAFVIAGGLIGISRPAHPIGWAFLALSVWTIGEGKPPWASVAHRSVWTPWVLTTSSESGA